MQGADARTDGSTPCLPWTDATRFETPEPLGSINTTSEEIEPFVSADGLTLYFTSDRPGGKGGRDIYQATRATPMDAFGSIGAVAAFNTAYDDGGLSLSTDGLTAYISSTRPGGPGPPDLFVVSRPDTATPFVAADVVLLAAVNGAGREFDPAPSADGRRLYFTADGIVAAGSEADLVFAERSGTSGDFGAPRAVPGVNPPDGREGNPWVSADELLIVFNSDRAGGLGGHDLWYATRADRDATFSAPRPVPDVNTSDQEGEVFVSADGCELYFGRTTGQRDLFHTRVVVR